MNMKKLFGIPVYLDPSIPKDTIKLMSITPGNTGQVERPNGSVLEIRNTGDTEITVSIEKPPER